MRNSCIRTRSQENFIVSAAKFVSHKLRASSSTPMTFRLKGITYRVVVTILLWLNVMDLSAQDISSKWNFLIEPYLIIPNMKGEVAVRRLPASEVDADAGSIFSKLKFGAMLYLEAVHVEKNWAISSDFIFMDLEQDVRTNMLITGGSVSAKQLAWELAWLKRLAQWLEVGLAGRLVSLESGLDLITINGGETGSISKTWFDPVIVVRSQGILKEKWLVQFRGDLGGFGIGSDFTWQIQANVGYKFSKLFQASAGYRIIAIDYNKGDGEDRFRYDVNTFGPVVRLGISLR